MTDLERLELYAELAAHADAPLPELLRMAAAHGANGLDATVCILTVQSQRGDLPRAMAAYCGQVAHRLTLQDCVDVMLILTRGCPELSGPPRPENGQAQDIPGAGPQGRPAVPGGCPA